MYGFIKAGEYAVVSYRVNDETKILKRPGTLLFKYIAQYLRGIL